MLPGSGGGDGGLFAGITARYLADAAVRRPELTAAASRLVLASATAAWDGRAEIGGGPVFSADWATPGDRTGARRPGGRPVGPARRLDAARSRRPLQRSA